MTPQVDIMMPVYNGLPHIKDSIASILAQTYPCWHCIICDDGSTDGTFDYLLTLEGDPRFTLLRNEHNQGRGPARQRILDASAAPYICMLDAGDMMHPERIALQVEYLEQNPGVGLVSSGMLSFGTTTSLFRVRGFGSGQVENFTGRGSVCFAPSMFRATIAKAAGVGFGSFSQCEDSYFLVRYYARNPLYYSIPRALYYYNEFDSLSKCDTLLSYLQLIVIGLRRKDLRSVALNMAKFGASLFILPFVSMEKRVAARGREATEEEVREFEKVRGILLNY